MQAMSDEQYARAISAFRKAIELAPSNVEYRRDFLVQREFAVSKLAERAKKSLDKGDHEIAMATYQEILLFDSGNTQAKAGLEQSAKIQRTIEDIAEVRRAMAKGDLDRAERILAVATERTPDYAETRTLVRELDGKRIRDIAIEPSLSLGYKKPINLEFRDASMRMIFDALSRTTGINFIFDRDVRTEQKTTVFFKQTSLEDSIDVILATNQLEKKVLNAGSILIYPSTPTKIKEYQDLVVRAFYLSNIEAKSAANMLKTVLRLKEIYVDERYNMMILREPAETLRVAEQLVALNDLEEPEVMLDVTVLEINRSSLLNLGVQISDQLTITPLTGVTTSTPGSTNSTATLTLNQFRRLNSDVLGITLPSATVNLQMKDGDAKLLANPSLRVRDRERAKILIGDKIPVVTTTATPNGFLSESIQYLDVGLKLEAEPVVRINSEIGLKISLEVSSIVGTIKTNNGSQAYQIGTRNYSSTLRLRDGETQVLAGLISDEERSSANRIPLIGKLPILGRLFSSQNDTRQKTEIVMSITPRLVRNSVRKEPRQETFWSGTESSVRMRPLQLRNSDQMVTKIDSRESSVVSTQSAGNVAPTSVTISNSSAGKNPNDQLHIKWHGPKDVKAGQPFKVELRVDSSVVLRAAPLQLSFNTSDLEIISVNDGGFFGSGAQATFGHVVDKPSGRISAASGTNNAAGAVGEGTLLLITARTLGQASDARISLSGFSPVADSAISGAQFMPLVFNATVTP